MNVYKRFGHINEIIAGAAYDAGERYDAPKCHPETRKAVLGNIKSWIDSDNEATKIMWLYGPAGGGKSAIAQTTAEDCHDEGGLAASFFFSRFAAGRNKKDGLVATIAFQLCVSIPNIKEYSNIKTQMQSLVAEPLSFLNQANPGVCYPRLIIIDGLDECEIRKDQAEIIEAIAKLVSMDHSSRLRVFLTSRPEVEIRQKFNEESISSICTRLALDDTFDPDKDIELFCHHILNSMLVSWPDDEDIDAIIRKSSGQFIYASTVVHYVSDSRHDPRKRLDFVEITKRYF
ncbi:P-loop containing nucleoside triphosphate hydrolase protein [Cyathus striatus]|nr:P-loop containing nucleoside triphosphate hydrolase protein [Cyathus striatus]